ncbi:hypothetical protein MBRU_00825 [Mycolicibacterium brumae DSM 44177]|nr:hypothetical protein MBRU_00825 [Mycolicibacterium brumae DSM 44177]
MLVSLPGIASADSYRSPANQQAIAQVIQRGLSQRGVPFVYGGGDINGPTKARAQTPTAPAAAAPGAQGAPQLGPGQTDASVLNPAPAPTLQIPGLNLGNTPAAPAVPDVAGFDASGLMVYSYAGAGIKLPRSSGDQYKVGQKVLPSQALPGDLLFYGPEGTQSVAMFLGNAQMLEVGSAGVTVSPVRTNDMTPYLVRIIA